MSFLQKYVVLKKKLKNSMNEKGVMVCLGGNDFKKNTK